MTLDRRTFGQLMLGTFTTAGLSGLPLIALAAEDATAILKKADATRKLRLSWT